MKTLQSAEHKALVAYLVAQRKKSGLTQTELARRLGRFQSFIAKLESGQRRIDVVELIALARAIGFDPAVAMKRIANK